MLQSRPVVLGVSKLKPSVCNWGPFGSRGECCQETPFGLRVPSVLLRSSHRQVQPRMVLHHPEIWQSSSVKMPVMGMTPGQHKGIWMWWWLEASQIQGPTLQTSPVCCTGIVTAQKKNFQKWALSWLPEFADAAWLLEASAAYFNSYFAISVGYKGLWAWFQRAVQVNSVSYRPWCVSYRYRCWASLWKCSATLVSSAQTPRKGGRHRPFPAGKGIKREQWSWEVARFCQHLDVSVETREGMTQNLSICIVWFVQAWTAVIQIYTWQLSNIPLIDACSP